jgi:hypothetical protein
MALMSSLAMVFANSGPLVADRAQPRELPETTASAEEKLTALVLRELKQARDALIAHRASGEALRHSEVVSAGWHHLASRCND